MFEPRPFLAVLSLAAAAAVATPAVKREISDAHHSSAYSSFPLPVTATLGAGRFSPLDYAGGLANLLARHDDYEEEADGAFYEYPQYALGYGGYEPYADDVRIEPLIDEEEVEDDVVWGSNYGDFMYPGFKGGYPRYPHYAASELFGRPAYYGWRQRGYHY